MATKTSPKTTSSPSNGKTTTTKSTTSKTTTEARREQEAAEGRRDPIWLHERNPKMIVRDSGYALTAVANDAFDFVRRVPSRVETWRDEAPTTAKELREDVPQRARKVSEGVETQVRTMRAKTREELTERLHHLEARFDDKAANGAQVFASWRRDPRVNKVETELSKVWEQSKNTRSQVKAAWTSIRKIADSAFAAGRDQADTAKSQVKAAVTSAHKTADTAVDAGKELSG